MKISDFGISRRSSLSTLCKTNIGTPLYQAPEISIDRAKYPRNAGYCGKMADFWSLGIILYVMVVAAPPATSPEEILPFVSFGKRELKWYGEDVKASAKDLIYRLLERNPNFRFSASDVLRHRWIKGYDSMGEYFQKIKSHPFARLPPLKEKVRFLFSFFFFSLFPNAYL